MRTLLCTLAALLATTAHAYKLKHDSTGAVVRWNQEARFVVDVKLAERLGDENTFNAVRAAVDAVAAAAPGLRVSVDAGETAGVGYDTSAGAVNRNEIVAPEEWIYDESAIAVAVVTLNVARHEIIDADIAFNTDHRAFKVLPEASRGGGDFDDIQNTLTHELGHAVGLAHNPEEAHAVMYPGARRGEVNKRVLHDDDRAGLLALYGDEAPAQDGAGLEPGVGCSAGGGTAAGWVLALVLPLLFAGKRRARGSRATRMWAVGALFAAGSASAAEPVAKPLERASLVATAEVVAARSLPPSPGARLLFTELEVRVRECIVGACGGTLRVRVPGGRSGDIEQYVEDHPVPVPGDVIAIARVAKDDPRRREGTRLYRLTDAGDFVRFARALAASGLSAKVTLPVSKGTSRSPMTPLKHP